MTPLHPKGFSREVLSSPKGVCSAGFVALPSGVGKIRRADTQQGFSHEVLSSPKGGCSGGVSVPPSGVGQLRRADTSQGYLRQHTPRPYRGCLISNRRDESQQFPVYLDNNGIPLGRIGPYQGQGIRSTGDFADHLFTIAAGWPSSLIFYLTRAIYRNLVGADFSSEGLDRAALAIHGAGQLCRHTEPRSSAAA